MPTDIVKPELFSNEDFGELRVILGTNGEPWFVTTDIAKVLGYRDSEKITRRLDPDEKGTRVTGTLGGEQRLSVISEAGLYRVIMLRLAPRIKDPAKREFVRKFQHWVVHEVLPAIRRDGGYMVARSDESEADIMARALVIANQTIERNKKQLQEQSQQIAQQSERIDELEPKAFFADVMGRSEDTYLVNQLAQKLAEAGVRGLGRNNLLKKLRNDGWLIKANSKDRGQPTAKARRHKPDLFKVVYHTYYDKSGKVRTKPTTRLTAEGIAFFFDRYTRECGIQAQFVFPDNGDSNG